MSQFVVGWGVDWVKFSACLSLLLVGGGIGLRFSACSWLSATVLLLLITFM